MAYIDNRSAPALRRIYTDASGALTLGTGDTTKTLVAALANYTLYVQRIVAYILVDDASHSLTFQDTNSSPVKVAAIPSTPGVDTRWDFDFGDTGMPLTQSKGLNIVPSGAGMSAQIEWYGYLKCTGAPSATSADRTV